MLVACQLVNLTTWEQARPALRWLMDNYSVSELAEASPRELHSALRPLGLWRRRSALIVRLARAWVSTSGSGPRSWQHILTLPGCGQYAADSWRIFVQGHTSVRPTDGKLKWYMSKRRPWTRKETRQLLEKYEELGWSFDYSGSGHIIGTFGAQRVTISSTPRCARSLLNAEADMKRAMRREKEKELT